MLSKTKVSTLGCVAIALALQFPNLARAQTLPKDAAIPGFAQMYNGVAFGYFEPSKNPEVNHLALRPAPELQSNLAGVPALKGFSTKLAVDAGEQSRSTLCDGCKLGVAVGLQRLLGSPRPIPRPPQSIDLWGPNQPPEYSTMSFVPNYVLTVSVFSPHNGDCSEAEPGFCAEFDSCHAVVNLDLSLVLGKTAGDFTLVREHLPPLPNEELGELGNGIQTGEFVERYCIDADGSSGHETVYDVVQNNPDGTSVPAYKIRILVTCSLCPPGGGN